jgi:hypothetical protein
VSGNICTQQVAVTEFTFQNYLENQISFSYAKGFVYSCTDVSGTAARNVQMDGVNHDQTGPTGCQKFAEPNGVTNNTLGNCVPTVGKCS